MDQFNSDVDEAPGSPAVDPGGPDPAPADLAGPDPAPAEPAGPDGQAWRDLVAAVSGLTDSMAAAGERAAARERVVERLFAENDRLRAGERLTVLRPVVVDLQRIRNDLLRQAATLPAEMSTGQVADLLRSFAFDAEQTLERCGVQIIRPDVGAAFDSSRHRAAAAVAAPGAELDATVAEVLADGYLDVVADRAISTAVVRVYRWSPPPTDTATPAEVDAAAPR